MMRILIILFVICCVVALIGYALFEPRFNSILSIIYFIWAGIKIREIGMDYLLLFVLTGIVDCIRDIVIAKDCYKSMDVEIDKFYLVKSLITIFTLGLGRTIFLLVVNPVMNIAVSKDIKQQVRDGKALPDASFYSKLKAVNYCYGKQIGKLEREGVVVSNKNTVDSETKIRREKLEKLYPKKMLDKIVDKLAGDKVLKEKRENAEKSLQSMNKCYAYLSTAVFEQYPKALTMVMSVKGRYSVSVISKFQELKPYNLMQPIKGISEDRNQEWSEYFIIQALQPLVAEGIFDDMDLNDNDAMDNHAYQYTKSTVTMPSIDGDQDPRFALDDD